MKRLILIFVLFVSLGPVAFGQQQPVTDLYLFEGLALNPAFAGSQVQISASLIHRDQWINFPGAPTTTFLSAHSGFLKYKMGIGFFFARDQIGIHQDYSFYLAYAYKITMSNGTLSMGLQGGFNNISSNFDLLRLKDDSDRLLSGRETVLNPNFGAGLYWFNDKSNVGLSVPYILNSSITSNESVLSEARRYRYYYLYGGHTFLISKNVEFKPSGLVRFQEGAPLSFDITGRFEFSDVVSAGMSYRGGDALIFILELKLHENLHFGYAYDYTLSEIQTYSNGTHEFMLNYRYRIPKIHKGLECPSYF